jgi:heme exporter protein D
VAIGAGGYGAILWLAGALAIVSLVLLLPPQRAALRQALVS